MLSIGSPAPELSAPDQHGRHHTLQSLLERGPLVLFFYPRDETPVCTREACGFRDAHDALQRLGASVAGVGGGDAASHRRFAETYRIPFPLLLDERGEIARAWGATWPFGGLRRRVTYVVDEEGVVRAAIWDELRAGRHVREAEEALHRIGTR